VLHICGVRRWSLGAAGRAKAGKRKAGGFGKREKKRFFSKLGMPTLRFMLDLKKNLVTDVTRQLSRRNK